jgi:hypothetical protein
MVFIRQAYSDQRTGEDSSQSLAQKKKASVALADPKERQP